MSPEDCVEIAELYADRFFGNAYQVVELGRDRIPPKLVIEQISKETGLTAEEVQRFAEIGDYVLLDRKIRDMNEDERAEWEDYKRSIVDFVGNVMTDDFIEEVVAQRERFEDDRRTIEEIWKASEKSDEEAVIERAKNMTSADTKRMLEMIFEDPSTGDKES
jgi:hypothetical protein